MGLVDAFQRVREAGAETVALIRPDIPTLAPQLIESAFASLESGDYDAFVGMTRSGAPYLMGLRRDVHVSIEAMTWNSVSLESSGLRVVHLPILPAVTDGPSLRHVIDDLATNPGLLASATRAALQMLRRSGASLPESPLPWGVQQTVRHFSSPWRNLDVDTVTTHSGAVIDYAYLSVDDAVWVVPVTLDGDIVLIRQYRHPVRDWCLEVPAGGVGEETLEDAAERELREEVGGTAQSLRYISSFYPSTAHLTSRGHVFLALGVDLSEAMLEATELLTPIRVPAEVVFDMARRGEVSEGQCALALLVCEQAIRAELGLPAPLCGPDEQILPR
jgi:ADP-ribose pyrophosphatase